MKPICSIIILSYNQFEYTKTCLNSIARYTDDVPYEVILIDNGSDAATVAALQQIEGIRLVRNEQNMGFAGGCNQGIRMAAGKYIMLLNNDTVVTEKWLANMVQLLEKMPEAAMTGPLTNATVGKQKIEVPYPQDDMQAMQQFALKIASGHAGPWRTLRLVAFCVLIRREVFEEIGLFDTNFAVGNYEDDDFNIRLLCAGKRSYICSNSFVHHFMNVSFRPKSVERERIMLCNKAYLERKWNHLDWNHHTVCNSWLLENLLARRPGNLLHIGCGLGALELELRHKDAGWHMTGMEGHPVRALIAKNFLDEMYPYSIDTLEELEQRFHAVVIECTLEKWGMEVLGKVKKLLTQDAVVFIRIFNACHVTSLEKMVTGQVGGELLCAASDEFSCYFGRDVEKQIEQYGYHIMACRDIMKTKSTMQQKLYDAVYDFLTDKEEPDIYNRIYQLREIGKAGKVTRDHEASGR